jgi:cysteine desulfurase
MSIYLDYAAATPLDSDVLAAMQLFFSNTFYNPSALYEAAVHANRALDEARASVASVLGAKQTEIVFTSGGTESNNLAIHGVMRQYTDAEIAFSAIEHDAVRMPAQEYAHSVIPVGPDGIVDPHSVSEKITDKTVLVSVMYANNEVGTVQPIKRISALLEDIRKDRAQRDISMPLYFHVDAAQAGNYMDLHVHRLRVDMLSINAGKLYGPKGAGVLYVRTGINLKPLMLGGGQERGLRSGTENIAGAAGMAAALQKAQTMKSDEVKRLTGLQQEFISDLQAAIPGVITNGSLKNRLPNNVHITVPGTDNERVLISLDMKGIYAAAGSACSASKEEPSHVLTAMGVPSECIRSSIRFSFGRQTTKEELTVVVQALRALTE